MERHFITLERLSSGGWASRKAAARSAANKQYFHLAGRLVPLMLDPHSQNAGRWTVILTCLEARFPTRVGAEKRVLDHDLGSGYCEFVFSGTAEPLRYLSHQSRVRR